MFAGTLSTFVVVLSKKNLFSFTQPRGRSLRDWNRTPDQTLEQMRSSFRSLCLGLLMFCGAAAMAQNTVTVEGSVTPCNGTGYLIYIFSDPSTTPVIDTVINTTPSCTYSFTFHPINSSDGIWVLLSCDGGITYADQDSTVFNANPIDSVVVNLSCGGTPDCLGIPGGPNLPGTACTDSIAGGVNTGIWSPNCICQLDSGVVDCLGIPGGPNQPGTSCTDALGNTGIWSAACACIANVAPCHAGFLATQAYDSTATGGVEPIPNNVWIYNLSSGGNGSYQFLWNFGDGDTSNVAYPTHDYAGPGPYTLCLTLYSGGCTDTYCDSISIDANGLLNGMVIDGHHANPDHRTNGFTLNVLQPTPAGIEEVPAFADLRLWPNPAQTELNLSFNNTLTGAVSVTVIDPSGRMVIDEGHNLVAGSTTLQLNTGNLDPGLYMVRIGNAAHSLTHRFMKIR